MTPEDFSENNIVNSLTSMLASSLLTFGYLLYWKLNGAVQTPDGWYYGWNTNYALYLADATFNARWGSAKGLLTLTDYMPTEPRFVERPIDVAGPVPQHEVLIPALSIEVGPATEIIYTQIGSDERWWNRHLVIEGYARTRTELGFFKDKLPIWLKGDTRVIVLNHDAGNLATVGDVSVLDPVTDYDINREGQEQITYRVIFNARLEYAA